MSVIRDLAAVGDRVLGTAGRAVRVLRGEGPAGLARRGVRVAYRYLGVAGLDLPLLDADIADSTTLRLPLPGSHVNRDRPMEVGWVITPPAPGSGGHTTLLRMVEATERAGHHCTLLLHDRYGGDIGRQEAVIRRWWPGVRAEVRSVEGGITGVDACVASSWECAHVLAVRGTDPMRRLYFIQDFEPYFYPRGSLYALAEDTYRFGFRCIALGEMVARTLRREVGIAPDVTEFGCDTGVYRILDGRPRTGVVLYARPEVPRRGYLLARMALERFHREHPDADIHIYGETVDDLPFPAVQHGRMTPSQLNELYNTCRAGLAMSFTNISLVTEEMLAAGVHVVANDHPDARADLPDGHVSWAAPTPGGLAEALGRAYTAPSGDEEAIASSVRQVGWTRAQADVVRILEEEVYGI
ncbi:MAG: glycosyltransferase family 1 protein [Acidipropionibacterium acidipropionici]|jgi:glycosyltransferase involved in cell wall biosynthesis|uniref:rhamnosyltransferase WsaF family glycosyltransferase n=1 Tax=Acidipropionibacterium acidipropionici TaxID=1748 RepID=UPI002F35FD69